MGAHDHVLRLGQRVLVALVIIAPTFAQAQSTPESSSVTNQVAASIERVRSAPFDTKAVTEARAVGFDLLRAARYQDALAVFKAVRDAVPGDQPSLYGSALSLFNLRRIAEAEQLVRLAIVELPPTSTAKVAGASQDARSRTADALVLLGVILAVKGDNAESLEAVARAVALAPESFDAQFALGRAHYGAGDPVSAAIAFRAAVRLRSDDTKARFFLATALERAGDDEGALAAYRELVAVQPDNAEGHLGIGVLLVKLGGDRSDEGINELSRAIALNGDLYEARVALGRMLIRIGRAAEAVDHLRRAAVLASGNPEPHFQLALAYRRLGRGTDAARETAIVQKLHKARREMNVKTNSSASANNSQ